MFKNQKIIKLCMAGASHPNGTAECAKKTVVVITRTILFTLCLDVLSTHFHLFCTYFGQFKSTTIYGNTILFLICSFLLYIKIYSITRFYPVFKTLNNFRIWGYFIYDLKVKFQNPGNFERSPRS